MPEFRRRLELDQPRPRSPFAEKSFFGRLDIPCLPGLGKKMPGPEDVPPVKASPTPIDPVQVGRPVEVGGRKFTIYIFRRSIIGVMGRLRLNSTKNDYRRANDILPRQLSGTIALADAIICVGTASQDLQTDERGEEGKLYCAPSNSLLG